MADKLLLRRTERGEWRQGTIRTVEREAQRLQTARHGNSQAHVNPEGHNDRGRKCPWRQSQSQVVQRTEQGCTGYIPTSKIQADAL